MVLDVHGPVPPAARLGHQQIGLAHPPAGEIDGQAPAQDERAPGLHRTERGILAPSPGPAGNDVSRRVKREKAAGDFFLELLAPREPARQHRRRRQGLTWPDDVPLGADRALLGHITALRWHARRIVASAHRPMVLTGGTIIFSRAANYRARNSSAMPSGRVSRGWTRWPGSRSLCWSGISQGAVVPYPLGVNRRGRAPARPQPPFLPPGAGPTREETWLASSW